MKNEKTLGRTFASGRMGGHRRMVWRRSASRGPLFEIFVGMQAPVIVCIRYR